MKGNVYEGRGKVTELKKINSFPIRVSRIETLPPDKRGEYWIPGAHTRCPRGKRRNWVGAGRSEPPW